MSFREEKHSRDELAAAADLQRMTYEISVKYHLDIETLVALVAQHCGRFVSCLDCTMGEKTGEHCSDAIDTFAANFKYAHEHHTQTHEEKADKAAKSAKDFVQEVCDSHATHATHKSKKD